MDTIINNIIEKLGAVVFLALLFCACNFLAWRRARREGGSDYRRPRLPSN